MLTRCRVVFTPSLSIAIAARTPVPPNTTSVANRRANDSAIALEATNRSPPTPSRTNASRQRRRLRSLVTGTDVLSSSARMP